MLASQLSSRCTKPCKQKLLQESILVLAHKCSRNVYDGQQKFMVSDVLPQIARGNQYLCFNFLNIYIRKWSKYYQSTTHTVPQIGACTTIPHCYCHVHIIFKGSLCNVSIGNHEYGCQHFDKLTMYLSLRIITYFR